MMMRRKRRNRRRGRIWSGRESRGDGVSRGNRRGDVYGERKK